MEGRMGGWTDGELMDREMDWVGGGGGQGGHIERQTDRQIDDERKRLMDMQAPKQQTC